MKKISTLRSKKFSINQILGGKTQIQHNKPFKIGNHVAKYFENRKCYSVTIPGWFKTTINMEIEFI